MKKICSLITVAIMSTTVFISSANASAISSGFTANTNSVEVGQSFTVNVILTDVAAWNVHVSASGPVSGCSLAVADATPDAMNTTKSFSATCNAIDEGTIVVSLSGDATNQDMVNNSISGTVNVVAHAALPQQIEEPTNNQPENPSADLPSNPTNSSSSNTSNEAQSNTSSLVHSNSNNQSSSSVDTVDSNTQTSVDDQKDNEVLTGRENTSESDSSKKDDKKENTDLAVNTKQENEDGGSNVTLIVVVMVFVGALVASGIILWLKFGKKRSRKK